MKFILKYIDVNLRYRQKIFLLKITLLNRMMHPITLKQDIVTALYIYDKNPCLLYYAYRLFRKKSLFEF